jgi:hypothetical protein
LSLNTPLSRKLKIKNSQLKARLPRFLIQKFLIENTPLSILGVAINFGGILETISFFLFFELKITNTQTHETA